MASLPEPLAKTAAGRHQLPREVVEEHQRDRIVDATIETFAKRGYQGTTVDHIVAAARIGVGSFYALFDGKEDCFLAVYDRIAAAARERIGAAAAAQATWPEQVCAALASLLELIAAEPLRARIVLAEAQTAGDSSFARHEAVLDEVALLLRPGRALSPRPEQLPPTLEEAIVGGVAWLLHQRLVMGELEGIEGLFPELALIALEPYLGEVEASALIATAAGAQAPA
ncbi:MAG TPA: TetR/AcrR family transcriptional regulator [Solirubrobacterales bacterium]|jgi:AcrR family transcriptional regulator|nr:TetR/AcrR family transcriptional regulator [Solirubrobacterales bacterium]